MTFTLVGLLLLATASTFPLLLLAAALVGVGSSVFHPESSRVARMASGGQHGLAQSVFQVGGNAGSAIGPLIAAFLIAPYGQRSIIWCALLALAGIVLTFRIGVWQRAQHASLPRSARFSAARLATASAASR
jgi:FSR family fosmidomycin resistance protein-like MFS transporter